MQAVILAKRRKLEAMVGHTDTSQTAKSHRREEAATQLPTIDSEQWNGTDEPTKEAKQEQTEAGSPPAMGAKQGAPNSNKEQRATQELRAQHITWQNL